MLEQVDLSTLRIHSLHPSPYTFFASTSVPLYARGDSAHEECHVIARGNPQYAAFLVEVNNFELNVSLRFSLQVVYSWLIACLFRSRRLLPRIATPVVFLSYRIRFTHCSLLGPGTLSVYPLTLDVGFLLCT